MSTNNILYLSDAQENEEVAVIFRSAIDAVTSGVAKAKTLNYRSVIILDSHYIEADSLLEFKLHEQPAPSFDADKEWDFVIRLVSLFKWATFSGTLRQWVEKNLRDSWMIKDERTGRRILNPELNTQDIPPALFDFACRIAVANMKWGASYSSITTEEIFSLLEKLGSDLPEKLKKDGSGDLPADLVSASYDGARISANDVTAIISVNITEHTADSYKAALEHIIRLLSTTDFPRSYWIQYQGPGEELLPIEELPAADVHRFFASAATFPQLLPLIAEYVQAGLTEHHWYTDPDLDEEYCAAPGTFAAFATAWANQKYSPTLLHYLTQVDGGHQELHIYFVRDYLLKYGPTPESLAALCIASVNCQDFGHDERFPALVANEQALKTLLALLGSPQEGVDPRVAALRASLGEIDEDYISRVRYALWDRDEESGGKETLASAPEELRPLYEKIFTLEPLRPHLV
ncbi:MAG: DUF6138 family protein [Actinomycetaceae bacterium]|nr:DUF6138 family protein [Actinomycetaceae bacterium]